MDKSEHVRPASAHGGLGNGCLVRGVTILRVEDKRSLWSDGTKESFFEPQKFGSKFGISNKRFKFLMSSMIFHDPAKANASTDPWYKSRYIVDTYNARVKKAWAPG